MSAIAGLFNLDGRPANRESLERMSARLAHRGPGQPDTWLKGPVGIVHRPGFILHEATRTQGIEAHDCVIAFDGWLDNRDELSDFGEGSDADLLLQAYLNWGTECFERIMGDFAVALFDKRRMRLLCARDPFAMKPLYYWTNGNTFAFASEIPALLTQPEISRVPNEETVAELLNWFGFSRVNTLFKGVYRLDPGHVLSVSIDGVHSRPFWTGEGIAELRLRSDAEYGEAFRDVVAKALKSRIGRHHRIGVRLSGGLDSSTILALSAELMGRQAIYAYSVVDAGTPGDESRFIDAACKHCGIASKKIVPARVSAEDLLSSAEQYMDLPDYPSGAQGDSLKGAVQSDGIALLLTGVGGDDWFFGSSLEYADLIRRFDFGGLLGAFRRNRDFREVVGSGIAPLVPANLRRALNRITHRHTSPRWIHPDLASKVDLYGKSQLNWGTRGYSGFAQWDTLRRATNPLETHLMEMEERSQWRFGISQRHPFFDRRVAEFALSLPQEQKQRQPERYKYIVRHAMKDRLPTEVLARTDSPGGVPTIGNMLRAPIFSSMFSRLKIAELGWVDQKIAQQMYAELVYGRELNALHVLALWRMAGLEAWARVAIS